MLELELQTIVSLPVGAGHRTWVVWKSSQRFQPRSHLPSLALGFVLFCFVFYSIITSGSVCLSVCLYSLQMGNKNFFSFVYYNCPVLGDHSVYTC